MRFCYEVDDIFLFSRTGSVFGIHITKIVKNKYHKKTVLFKTGYRGGGKLLTSTGSKIF